MECWPRRLICRQRVTAAHTSPPPLGVVGRPPVGLRALAPAACDVALGRERLQRRFIVPSHHESVTPLGAVDWMLGVLTGPCGAPDWLLGVTDGPSWVPSRPAAVMHLSKMVDALSVPSASVQHTCRWLALQSLVRWFRRWLLGLLFFVFGKVCQPVNIGK